MRTTLLQKCLIGLEVCLIKMEIDNELIQWFNICPKNRIMVAKPNLAFIKKNTLLLERRCE